MIQSFRDETTRDLYASDDTPAARQVPRLLWPVVQRKLLRIDVAAQLSDLAELPDRVVEIVPGTARYTVRVTHDYRITFEWREGDAYEVGVEASE